MTTREWIHDGLNVSFKGWRLGTGAGKKGRGLDMRAGGWRQGISNQIFYLDLVCLGFPIIKENYIIFILKKMLVEIEFKEV